MISTIIELPSSKFRGTVRHIMLYHYMKYRKGKILDIGSGLGVFGIDNNSTALEPNGEAVKIMKKKGINAVCGTGQNIPFPDNIFDTVTCFHVIEHTKDGEKIIKEAHRVLKTGGTFILAVPDWDTFNDYKDCGHVRFYSQNMCLKHMLNSGFDVIKTGYGYQLDIKRMKFVREMYFIGVKNAIDK